MAKTISKPLALAIAAGLTFGGSLGVAAPAMAQTQVDQPANVEQAPSASSIPAGNDFSLTVHKRANPQTLRNATGQEDPQAGGEGINGVPFKVQKLQGDVRKQSEYNRLVDLTNKYNGGDRDVELNTEGDAQNVTTSNDGTAQLQGLSAGAYLVEEQDSDVDGLIKGKSFIVMVPMPQDGGNWTTDVHVYPKNSQVSVTKEVEDADKHAKLANQDAAENHTVSYTLSGVIPSAPQGEKLADFKLTDWSNSAELDFGEGTDFIESVERVSKDGQTVELSEGQYTIDTEVAVPAGKKNSEKADQAFQVVVADPAAAGFQPGDTLRVKVKATLLKSNNEGDQDIENTVNSSGFFRGSDQDVGGTPFETPEDDVTTYVGKIKVVKHEEGNDDNKLAGAAFDLRKCGTQDVIASGETNEQGELLFEGLHVGDFANNKEIDIFDYCLEETKAPEGFTATQDEIRVTLTRESSGTVNEQTVRLASVDVANKPNTSIPLLPSTGGMGILIVALVGLGIIAGGVYAARRNSAKA